MDSSSIHFNFQSKKYQIFWDFRQQITASRYLGTDVHFALIVRYLEWARSHVLPFADCTGNPDLQQDNSSNKIFRSFYAQFQVVLFVAKLVQRSWTPPHPFSEKCSPKNPISPLSHPKNPTIC